MRLEGIDILRGLAVSFVIIYHFFALLNLDKHPFFHYIHHFGILGVSLFFIISGYLIYQSIEYSITKKGVKKGLKQYTLHRLFRILPAYYFNFIIIFILALYVFNTMDTWSAFFIGKQIFSHLTFSSFFIYKISGLGINGAYWTLSIEMLWYIVAPILFLYIKKDIYLIFLLLLSFLYLWGLDHSFYDIFLKLDPHMNNYINLIYFWSFQLPGQLSYFVTGILIYKYTHKYVSLTLSMRYISLFSIIALYIYISNQTYFHNSFLLKNLLTLLTVFILFTLFYQSKIRGLNFLSWIGKISYSLYLWHMPLLFLIKKYLMFSEIPLWCIAGTYILLLLVISTLSYYLIEEGGLSLRKKLEINN